MEIAKTIITVDIYNTLLIASLVLLLGNFLTQKVSIFNRLTLPSPVVGGLIAAILSLIARTAFDIQISFDGSLTEPLMLMFFASIGLNANLKQLMSGGKIIAIFLIGVVGLLILQNAVGVGLATALGQNPLLGLLAGSITLSGGHGTGAAWGSVFSEKYGFTTATEIAMACATFGLVLGGIIGGPIAKFLINRKPENIVTDPTQNADNLTAFDRPTVRRAVTAGSIIETIAMLAICLSLGTAVAQGIKLTSFDPELPTFVYVLFIGVILNNLIHFVPNYEIFERGVSIVGNVCLSLFLAMALMSLKLWELSTLAVPMLVILTVQAITMALYAIFITYRLMGRDYTAAVLSAGHCGFGLGATPTAIANMQVVTEKYGPAPIAFIVVPMVGAFFIDLVNVLVIQGFLKLPMFTSMLSVVGS